MKRLIFLLILLIGLSSAASAQGVISCSGSYATVVACLAPNQWGEVTGMTGWQNYNGGGQSILDMYPTAPTTEATILAYMDKGAYNPATHEIFIYGGPHPATPSPFYKAFVKLNLDTGLWSRLSISSDAQLATTGQHYYDFNTIDTVNQDFYVREFSLSNGEWRGMKYHIPDGTWTTLNHNYPQNGGSSDNFESFEYFPDVDKLTWTDAGFGTVSGGTVSVGNLTWYDKTNPIYGPAWTFTNGSATDPTVPTLAHAYNLGMGVSLAVSRYDSVHHLMIFGGGTPDFTGMPPLVTAARQLYTLDLKGNVTALPLAPVDLINDVNLMATDPVTGDILVWFQPTTVYLNAEIHFYSYHLGDVAWIDHGNVTSTAGFLWNSGYASADPAINRPLFAEVTASDPDNGVTLITEHVSPTTIRQFVYRYDQPLSLSVKCALSGVLNCWSFDSSTNIDKNGQALRYHWDSGNANLNNDPLLTGKTNYGQTGWRNPGEANAEAFNMFATPQVCALGMPGTCNSVPYIDTTTKWEGGGSLVIPMRQYSMEETAQYDDNLDGQLGHPNVAICGDITKCPQGNTIYAQVMARLNPSLTNDYVFECSLQLNNTCYNGDDNSVLVAHAVNSGGGTTSDKELDCPGCHPAYLTGFCTGVNNPGDCIGSHIGKRLYLYQGPTGANCVPGIYTINVVNTYQQVVLDRSPSTVGGQCSHPVILVEHISSTSGGAQGWKFVLLVSNALPLGPPPNGSLNGNCECEGEVNNRGNQNFLPGPQFYDTKGHNSPPPQQDYLFLANGWHEYTERVIVGDVNVNNTRVTWWVDGNLAYDWTTGNLIMDGGDDGYGLGQVQLETYTTKRDPFYQGSGEGDTWYDNLITSTQPIPFNSAGGGNVVPCTSPFKVVFTSQPSSAILGASLGTVVAQIQDSTGVLCSTATNSVTLSKAGGATWNNIVSSSSLTKNAAGGVVTWNDLYVTPTVGSGSIAAASSGLTGANSVSINITNPTCVTPSKVVFTAQPSDASVGISLGTVTAQIQDSSSLLCNTATNAVTLSKNGSATWNALVSGSSLTKSASGGIVTWTDLSVTPTAGSGSIDASSSGLTGAVSTPFNVTNPPSSGQSNRVHVRPY